MSGGSCCLVPLDKIDSPRECGEKAYKLGRLIRSGHAVPRGVALPNSAMQRHLLESGALDDCHALLAEFRRLEVDALKSQALRIRSAILETPLRAELQTEIAEHYTQTYLGKRLAVRSSGICEDGQSASFAGQLDSILNVGSKEDLISAVPQVWASLWSDSCLLYARRNGLIEARMGVVIQEMVAARCSGIMFTCDPVSADVSDELVIEYTSGLGDALAAGRMTPRRASVGRHGLALACHESDGDAAGPALPNATLREIALVGMDLEKRFGAPQDIEWSIDGGGEIVLLQSRPISVPAPVDLVAWTNANIAENYTGPVSPFLYSVVTRGYTAYFRGLARAFGISQARVSAMDEAFENIVGVHAGRLYYNLTNIHTLINLAPFGPWLTGSFNEFTGASGSPRIALVQSKPWRRAAELARIALKTTRQYLGVKRGVSRFEQTVDRYADETRPESLSTRSPRELLRLLRGFLEIRERRWNDAALADVAAMVCYQLLKLFLERRLGDADSGLHNDLLKGLPDLASTRPARELWQLSRVIREVPKVFDLFAQQNAEAIRVELDRPELSEFRAALDRYLADWGFRYSSELMLTTPTPQEQPEPVIRLLKAYAMESGPGPEGRWSEQSITRRHATAQTAERLTPARWRRWNPLSRSTQFRVLLAATQGAIRLRERARMKQALLYTRLRHVMLHVGDVLAQEGYIEERNQVFFLTVDEVQSLLSGDMVLPATTQRSVALRCEEFERLGPLEPPDAFRLPWGERWTAESKIAAAESDLFEAALRGTGACGGTADGAAAVALNVTETERIRRGQILVTRQTDPGWAAVFFLIKGLVVERGGMLSHGAILAREYGIPTVVGVPGATDRIQDGDHLRVNGDSGSVEFRH